MFSLPVLMADWKPVVRVLRQILRALPPRSRRFRRRPAINVWIGLLLLGLVLWRVYQTPDDQPFPFDPDRAYRVQRVIDGDTFVLADETRVRLIGVDTPETKAPGRPVEPLGPEATVFTRRLVEGREVRLEFDRERRDRYDRVLAYVHVGEVFLNEELIRAGLSPAATQYPYSSAMKRRFRAVEEEAQAARRGLWAGERTEWKVKRAE